MKSSMKRILAISTAVVMSTVLLAGCGSKKEETVAETETETAAPEKLDLDASIGTVVSLKSNKLTIETSANKELEFDVTDAVKKSEKDITAGNQAAVVYSGKISGTDTSDVTVELVIGIAESTGTSSTTTSGTSTSGEMTGTVVEYTEGGKLVIENAKDGESYYFSTANATVSSTDDIEEDSTVTVSYTGDINGDDLVPATKITLKTAGTSSAGSSTTTTAAKGETISGTVTDATMNTVTIETTAGVTYTFSTMDADIDITGGLETDMDVTLYYNGDLTEGAENVTVTSVEENK
ncbi:MAG: hypothetical protein EOM34_01900 [Clostridia bacterium]|nr:hypothetical protein [Clostridia bacterium]NCD01484.1 hypothetical protein [Clostridia bacterium]